MSNAERFTQLTRSTAALSVALDLPQLGETACGNQHLPTQLWMSQYSTKPQLAKATALASRPLSDEQFDQLIEVETRGNVVKAAIKAGTRPSLDALTRLATKKMFNGLMANVILDQCADTIDTTWLSIAGPKAGGRLLLEHFLRCGDALSDVEIGEQLLTYEQWGDKWDNERRVELIAQRPGLLPWAVRSDSLRLRTSAAGSSFLLDRDLQRQVADLDGEYDTKDNPPPAKWVEERAFIWIALVCNPACHLDVVAELEPWVKRIPDYENSARATNRLKFQPFRLDGPIEDVTDERLMDWLCRRVLPSDMGGKIRGRENDLAALISMRNMTEAFAEKILSRMKQHPSALDLPPVAAALKDLIARFPEVAADVVISEEFIDTTAAAWSSPQDIYSDYQEREPTEEEIRRGSTYPINSGGYLAGASAYLDANVKDSVASWLVVFRMLDEGFNGTFVELAMIANASG